MTQEKNPVICTVRLGMRSCVWFYVVLLADLNKLYYIVNVQVDEWNCRHDVAAGTGGREGGLAVSITDFDL